MPRGKRGRGRQRGRGTRLSASSDQEDTGSSFTPNSISPRNHGGELAIGQRVFARHESIDLNDDTKVFPSPPLPIADSSQASFPLGSCDSLNTMEENVEALFEAARQLPSLNETPCDTCSSSSSSSSSDEECSSDFTTGKSPGDAQNIPPSKKPRMSPSAINRVGQIDPTFAQMLRERAAEVESSSDSDVNSEIDLSINNENSSDLNSLKYLE